MQNDNKKSGLIKMISALVVIVLAGFGWWKMKGDSPNQTVPLREIEDSNDVAQIVPDSNSKYKNGVYSAIGKYVSPAGNEEIDISLVIANDTVTAGSFKGKAINPTSIKLQDLFSQGFNSYVVGKKIDDLKLVAINGSSLTPKGFIDALEKIKLEAKN